MARKRRTNIDILANLDALPQKPTTKDLASALKNTGQLYDHEQIIDKIVFYFGGVDNFAQALHVEFINAPAGSIVRQRILAMIADFVQKSSELKSKRSLNVEDMTTDELEALLRHYLSEKAAQPEDVGRSSPQ